MQRCQMKRSSLYAGHVNVHCRSSYHGSLKHTPWAWITDHFWMLLVDMLMHIQRLFSKESQSGGSASSTLQWWTAVCLGHFSTFWSAHILNDLKPPFCSHWMLQRMSFGISFSQTSRHSRTCALASSPWEAAVQTSFTKRVGRDFGECWCKENRKQQYTWSKDRNVVHWLYRRPHWVNISRHSEFHSVVFLTSLFVVKSVHGCNAQNTEMSSSCHITTTQTQQQRRRRQRRQR